MLFVRSSSAIWADFYVKPPYHHCCNFNGNSGFYATETFKFSAKSSSTHLNTPLKVSNIGRQQASSCVQSANEYLPYVLSLYLIGQHWQQRGTKPVVDANGYIGPEPFDLDAMPGSISEGGGRKEHSFTVVRVVEEAGFQLWRNIFSLNSYSMHTRAW